GAGGVSPGGATVSGSATGTLKLTKLRLGDSGVYDCAVSNPCTRTYSAPVTITVICPADVNRDLKLSTSDVYTFLKAFIDRMPPADVNNSGAVTVQDFFDFLRSYFAGC